MKEIIYLDTKLVNSLLAQLNEGLINKLTRQNGENQGSQETKSESHQQQALGNAGIPTIFNIGGSYTHNNTTSRQEGFTTNTSNSIETALDDYSLDVLLNTLASNSKIKNASYKDGDIVKINGELTSYNFQQLKGALDLETVEFLLPDYQTFKKDRAEYDKIKNNPKHFKRKEELQHKLDNNPWNNFKNLQDLSTYFDKLAPNSNLIKVNNALSFCPLEHFRVTDSQLSFMQLGKRNATMLAIISSTIDEQIPSDFSNLSESHQLIRLAPNTLTNILLGSFNLIQNGDSIVRPIAIYFED